MELDIFLSIVDYFSRRVWVYLLKSKDETYSRFNEWKTLVERKKERKVKVLRTENRLEFLSGEFKKMCQREVIERNLTVKGTPQQNGLAERMNHTLLERMRCLLSNANLSKDFWGEAVSTATFLINRSLSSAIGFNTPLDKWTGKPPNLNNLRVFGCVAYAHSREGKLDHRAKKCLFLGYPHGVKGYRLWCMEKG